MVKTMGPWYAVSPVPIIVILYTGNQKDHHLVVAKQETSSNSLLE